MYRHIDTWSSRAAGFLLFCLMLLTFLDVAGRNLVNRPVSGTSELTELMLAAVIFLMLPRVAIAGQHIVIDLVDTMVPKAAVAWLDAFASLLGAVMFFLIGWQVWVMGDKALGYDDRTPTLHIPMGPILYAMGVFAAMVGIAFVFAMVNSLRGAPAPVDAGLSSELAEHSAGAT
jgi:TRAP-type C4-dicarboxylate transport system permease small subunit